MVKAKPGYEDLYEAVVAKQAKLDAEKASKIDAAISEIEAEFSVKITELANLFAQVSVIVEDPMSETMDETPIADETIAAVEPIVAG